MNQKRNSKKQLTPQSFLVLAFFLVVAEPRFLIALIPAGIIWLIIKIKKASVAETGGFSKSTRSTHTTYTTPVSKLDDCYDTVCRHSDRSEHHVRRGREQDPWDRPDIDVSKYQRRQK